jgi:hypothetical protein
MPIIRDKITVGGREIPFTDIEKYLTPEQISQLIKLKKIPKLKKQDKKENEDVNS